MRPTKADEMGVSDCVAIIVFAFTAAFLVASVAAFSAAWALAVSI
jgi:hypothetical protein